MPAVQVADSNLTNIIGESETTLSSSFRCYLPSPSCHVQLARGLATVGDMRTIEKTLAISRHTFLLSRRVPAILEAQKVGANSACWWSLLEAVYTVVTAHDDTCRTKHWAQALAIPHVHAQSTTHCRQAKIITTLAAICTGSDTSTPWHTPRCLRRLSGSPAKGQSAHPFCGKLKMTLLCSPVDWALQGKLTVSAMLYMLLVHMQV